jgi:hypothetical protein
LTCNFTIKSSHKSVFTFIFIQVKRRERQKTLVDIRAGVSVIALQTLPASASHAT